MNSDRRKHATQRQQQQSGASLISLMVGLVISMVVVVSLLGVYKTTTRTTLSSKEDSATDSMRMSSILGAQIKLQGAGYGITGPAQGTDMVFLSGAAYNSATAKVTGTVVGNAVTGNAVIWGENTGAGYTCQGLLAPAAGGLTRLPPVACANAAAWAAVSWSPVVLDDSPRSVTTITRVDTANCSAYGIVGKGSVTVQLSTQTKRLNYNQTNNTSTEAATKTSESTVCLVNFPVI